MEELIVKIVPEVWACLRFSSKITFLYHIALYVCNFLPFSSKCLTRLPYATCWGVF
ncbi:hypothetical protein HanRHA438_Chr16g0755321 [Helianthus annuus]|nr:hypothetical protein HanRHA438_Chr16g0755321 [Helianthus annuus]